MTFRMCQPQILICLHHVLQDKADGGKRCAEDAATSEQHAGAPRKPRRATKRRLF